MTKAEQDTSPQESFQDPKRVVAFDLDGTLATGNIWASLNTLAGITEEEDLEWVRQFETGELAHKDWFEILSARHREGGMTRDQYVAAIKEQADNNIRPEARVLVSDLLAEGIKACIVSGGIDLYVGAVAEELGIDRWRANYSLEFDENEKFQSITYIEDGGDHKVTYLKKLGEELGIPLSEITFVGDSSNDIAAFQATGRGIYLHEGTVNPNLVAASWKQVHNLSEVRQFLLD